MRVTHIIYERVSPQIKKRVGFMMLQDGIYHGMMATHHAGIIKLTGPTYEEAILRVEGAFRIAHEHELIFESLDA